MMTPRASNQTWSDTPIATNGKNDVQTPPLQFQPEGIATTDVAIEGPARALENEDDSGIECICCLGEQPFESMVQCREGHLVCLECLKTYTTYQTYGAAKLELQCMSDDCSASYPRSEMERCLSQSLITKWDERIQVENLKLSGLDLSRCPACPFACVMSPTAKIFTCRSESCRKVSCRKCGANWDGHQGKRCEVIEEKDETHLRKKYEERMTKATLRICPKCTIPFYKEDGCNKMRCPCGLTMCYICRETEITYGHFCGHPHSPGKGCRKCTKCCLWTSTKQDDDRALRELKWKAANRRETLGYQANREIGVPMKRSTKTKTKT